MVRSYDTPLAECLKFIRMNENAVILSAFENRLRAG